MVLKTKRQAYVLEAGNLCTWMMIVTGVGRKLAFYEFIWMPETFAPDWLSINKFNASQQGDWLFVGSYDNPNQQVHPRDGEPQNNKSLDLSNLIEGIAPVILRWVSHLMMFLLCGLDRIT